LRDVILDLRNKMEAVRIHLDLPHLDHIRPAFAAELRAHWKASMPEPLLREVLSVERRLYRSPSTRTRS
jgi:hypothetical protein